MVKSGEYRATKFGQKFDPEVVRSRFASTKDLAVNQQNARQAEHAVLMASLREILNEYNIPSTNTLTYSSFCNKIWGLSRKFGGNLLQTEAYAQVKVWLDRQANLDVLNEILALFGISPYTP